NPAWSLSLTALFCSGWLRNSSWIRRWFASQEARWSCPAGKRMTPLLRYRYRSGGSASSSGGEEPSTSGRALTGWKRRRIRGRPSGPLIRSHCAWLTLRFPASDAAMAPGGIEASASSRPRKHTSLSSSSTRRPAWSGPAPWILLLDAEKSSFGPGPHARHVAPMSSTNDLTSSSGCPTHMTSSAEWSAQWRCQLAANKSVWLMNLSLLHLRSSTVRHVNALGVIPRRPSCIAIKRALLPGDAVAQGRNVIQVLGCKPGQVLPGMPGLGGPSDDGQVRRH